MNLKAKYEKLITDAFLNEKEATVKMAIPRLEKIVINAGVGDGASDVKLIESMNNDIKNITGQTPVLTKSKKAIATFKLRENQPIGVKVTLRGERMWNFVSQLINVALPRVRDFKGAPLTSFDGRGNYTYGVKEQLIFPTINFDDVKKVRGFDVTFVTSCKSDAKAKLLLTAIGWPFAKPKGK
ncbi:MAG: 50S ribosomal protein L5 [Mycoplasmataceae bacterium]|nr:50S ribosomal protein L5 [Mycoplasmataceae bacterium]